MESFTVCSNNVFIRFTTGYHS